MSLSSLLLKPVYRSARDDLVKDFYLPCLKSTVRYDRAVGFFSASMLSLAAQGLTALVERRGQMRLIVGGALTEEEAEAVLRGYAERAKAAAEERLQFEMRAILESISDSLLECRLHALSNLVAAGRLDIKVALTRKGMYHEKIGVFYDAEGNSVVFAGSANESQHALSPDFNFESISVYPSWNAHVRSYHDEYASGFASLWANTEERAIVLDFPKAAQEELIKFASARAGMVTPDLELAIWDELRRKYVEEGPATADALSRPTVPRTYKGDEFSVRTHQREALRKWKANDFLGILELATGAGKTVTAIYAATQTLLARGRLALIVAVPYQSLAEQWVEELALFGWRAIPCFGGWQLWQEKASELAMAFRGGGISCLAFVVVNATLGSEKFQDLLAQIPPAEMMWVGDECHHHGSERLARSVPGKAKYTLGLSATPFDEFSEMRNDRIHRCYGQVVSTYGLREALQDGVLTPYEYHVHSVELTDRETLEYIELSNKIRSLMQAGADAEENAALTAVLMQRARLLGAAANKLVLLDEILDGKKVDPMTLFYCGDGSVEGDDDSAAVRQIDAVSMLAHRHGWRTSHFTARESRKERQAILDDFRLNNIDALVAIRCLDEGVDVPACRVAYILASSRNPRQFIQRRGRILRRSPGKDHATIHDFLVHVPPTGDINRSIERSLVQAELKRVAEFTACARNFSEVFSAVRPLLDEYDLLHNLVAGSLRHHAEASDNPAQTT